MARDNTKVDSLSVGNGEGKEGDVREVKKT